MPPGKYQQNSSKRGRQGGGYTAAPRTVSASAKEATGEALSTSAVAVNPYEPVERADTIDTLLGSPMMNEGKRVGWMVNMLPTYLKTLRPSVEWESGVAAVDFYFIEDDGQRFKASIIVQPYFLIACRSGHEPDVEEFLKRKFGQTLCKLVREPKEDLDMPNHLLGHKRVYLKLCFHNSEDMQDIRRVLMPAVKKNQENHHVRDAFANFGGDQEIDKDMDSNRAKSGFADGLDHIVDIREYDVPYLARVCIDHDYRVGKWYTVTELNGSIQIEELLARKDELPAEPVVLAFDIETSKAPLKFPDANVDPIMMISYMIDRQGYLITNREIVGDGIVDFDYSPKPGEFDGPFIIFNEPDEKLLLVRFFEHIREMKPSVYVTYNGDFFDWPYVETRTKMFDMDMRVEIGVFKNEQGEYSSTYASHMDCFKWVKRDSYLPVGSQGLKAVTKYKLGYDPKELDPELMTIYAMERPQILADYSVSDAVATYYLYMKYVHPFVFSLCNIIPLNPDDVLRKGSGTLCEMLLMAEAFKANIVMPNKHVDVKGKLYEGHLLESETYVGGHVEALESGVFRSDISTHFQLDSKAFETLLNDLTRALTFFITKEEGRDMTDVVNFDEIRDQIALQLEHFAKNPNGSYEPLIYHLDVAAMYPNIILTNRLQPPALIDDETCAACDFNRPDANCQRRMKWSWRGEYFPADRGENRMIQNQLQSELFPPRFPNQPKRTWVQLAPAEQSTLISKRLGDYSRKVYKKIHASKVENRESVVCQRENPFYVDTVKNFRDRRYDYKTKLKNAKKALEAAVQSGDPSEIYDAQKKTVVYDSLQLAHKCILNSFYGYVMRKGSRWYSMEMAGIVCLTGAHIIKMAREIVERVGRPLELDTDGIWCILPRGFPENFVFKMAKGKNVVMSYPGAMLNHLVQDQFTNHQYQTLEDPDTFEYRTTSENSIFFEVDGPYRAMILPASKEENKLLKKRYAVFEDNGRLAELKGFEIKRRGELKIIKIFQEEVFSQFLEGANLEECYRAVGDVANRWLDILYTQGATVSDEDLLEYISENRSMSKTLEDYGSQKSTSISTAKRLAEFLGDQMVKDKGLACKFIIAKKPIGAPVAERAIPVAIFSAEESVKRVFVRKWLHDQSVTNFDVRTILDWQYYIERLGSSIQKVITIPAAMQHIANPVPRIVHPDWLLKRSVGGKASIQNRITDLFQSASGKVVLGNEKRIEPAPVADMEDAVTATKTYAPNLLHGGIVTKRGAQPVIPQASTEGIIGMQEDYIGWLRQKKAQWKEKWRQKRIVVPSGNVTAASIFQKQQLDLMQRPWEIVQIAETDIHGQFKLWVLVDKQLKAVRIGVPRIFQVNSKLPDPTHRHEPVAKILPRSHQALNLYQFELEEHEYQEKEGSYKSFEFHSEVVGAYEKQIPLVYRALLRLGCVAKLSNSKGNLSSDDSFLLAAMKLRRHDDNYHLYDLEDKKLNAAQYLDQRRMQYIYVYHSSSDVREIFCIFYPENGRTRVIVVDPYNNSSLPSISKMYAERRARLNEQNEMEDSEYVFQYPDTLQVEASSVPNEKEAYKLIQRELTNFQNNIHGPTSILIQSPRDASMVCRKVRVMGDFPVIPVPSKKIENMYPALDWQRYAARYAIRNFLSVHSYVMDRIVLARYCNVPVGNIGPDATSYLSDLSYGRALSEKGMCLWYSPTERPDFGGREDEDNFFAVQDITDPEVDSPDLYNTICIQYDIDCLPMNAILQSVHINEMEGSDGNAGLANNPTMSSIEQHMKKDNEMQHDETFDMNTPSYAAFKAMKDLVKGWAKSYLAFGDPVGETMLKNFYRWVSSANSKLYDPALYSYIHGLMKKSLMLLVAEFKRLGSKIVHADFNKIIIVTTKTSYEAAVAYNDFILKTIKSKEVFMWIDLQSAKYWNELVWMDKLNFGGISAEPPGNNDENQISATPVNNVAASIQISVDMHWNICRFLPTLIQPVFTKTVAEFILKIHDMRVKFRNGAPPGNTPARGVTGDGNVDASVFTKQKLVREYFTRKLLKTIPEIQHAVTGATETDEQMAAVSFPRLPGSHLDMMNPTLELVKYICQVFGLSKELENEVRIMRRTLLNLIQVREFSPEAQYQNPCDSFVLPHLFCSFCQHCRDLDLASDTGVAVPNTMTKSGSTTAWLCTHCHQHYDHVMIEESLVRMVQRMLAAFQLQDLCCPKCRLTKVENLREQCKNCAGPYSLAGVNQSQRGKPADERKVLMRKLNVLKNIASMQEMSFLGEIVEWTLSTI